jgi:hypothetical protein
LADEAIARAIVMRRGTHAPMFASTRLYSAMALLAMDRKEKVIEYLRTAREADLNGKYGALAIRQLQQLSV